MNRPPYVEELAKCCSQMISADSDGVPIMRLNMSDERPAISTRTDVFRRKQHIGMNERR